MLVHGYLTKGHLSPEEEDFFFRYGVLLQLLDDMQDVAVDQAAGHHTIFSNPHTRGALDASRAALGEA